MSHLGLVLVFMALANVLWLYHRMAKRLDELEREVGKVEKRMDERINHQGYGLGKVARYVGLNAIEVIHDKDGTNPVPVSTKEVKA